MDFMQSNRTHYFIETFLSHKAVLNSLKPLSHQSDVLTAFPGVLKVQTAEMRAVQSQVTLCALCVRAVPSPRTPCGGYYFEHAQRQSCGLAFAQRARQGSVRTLWQRCGVFYSAVSAPRARCEDTL